MDILFVATELAPMIKVGGLADVASALSKALRLLGHKVTIALPHFPAIEAGGLMLARRLTPLVLPLAPAPLSRGAPLPANVGPGAGGRDGGGPRAEVTLFDGRLGSGVELLVLDIAAPAGDASALVGASGAPLESLYHRPGIYGEHGVDYPDNDRRFGLFSRAVVEIVRQRSRAGAPFDIVHAHDWPAAMVTYLIREHRAELSRTRTALTIHNLAHQGMFSADALAYLGLGPPHFATDRLEFYGQVNFLKGGILAADAITTVSNTYAREILTPEFGERLEGVLSTRREQIQGIVNGIDYAVWNPMTDPALVARYDAEDMSNKGRCKSALFAEIGLEIQPDRPLIVSIGRIVHQKGSDLLAAALPRILKSDVSVVIAGAGDEALESKLRAAVAKNKERAAFLGDVSEQLAHRLFAAADIVVIPSRYEPCGLTQLYAQRYGALPVATATGGLCDTIVDADAALETGSGFLFDKPTATALTGAVQRAIAAMSHPRWAALRRRVMRLDLGWDRPARRYAQRYRALLAEERRPAEVSL
jgi:starch synthase